MLSAPESLLSQLKVMIPISLFISLSHLYAKLEPQLGLEFLHKVKLQSKGDEEKPSNIFKKQLLSDLWPVLSY